MKAELLRLAEHRVGKAWVLKSVEWQKQCSSQLSRYNSWHVRNTLLFVETTVSQVFLIYNKSNNFHISCFGLPLLGKLRKDVSSLPAGHQNLCRLLILSGYILFSLSEWAPLSPLSQPFTPTGHHFFSVIVLLMFLLLTLFKQRGHIQQ